jgi:DNA polymerase-3 subunit delta'
LNGSQKGEWLTDFPGHASVKSLLLKACVSGRLPQSLLFVGPPGVGKFATALSLARFLLCGARGCGVCATCRAVASLSHADLKVVIPTPKEDSEPEAPERYGTFIAEKAKNPYFMPAFKKQPSISIDTIRGVSAWLSYTPASSCERIAIIVDAHMMGTEAQNAFLKTLEEPPESARIIMTTSNPYDLLPTILSRVERFQFGFLTESEIVEYLSKKSESSIAELRLLARLADGSMARALEMLDEEKRRLRNEFVTAFQYLFEPNELRLINWIGEQERFPLDEFLSVMLSLAHDLLLLCLGADESKVNNIDQLSMIRMLSGRVNVESVQSLIGAIEKASRALQSHPHYALLILSLHQAYSAKDSYNH